MEWVKPGEERGRARGQKWRWFVYWALSSVLACNKPVQTGTPVVAVAPPGTVLPPAAPQGHVPSPVTSGAAPNAPARLESPVPVLADDATWGDPSAPVEMVAFLDLHCPFSQRAQATLATLRKRYGRARLHLVTKHLPLYIHAQAHLAAQVARTVQELAGPTAFEEFVQLVYVGQTDLDREHLLEWAERAGAARAQVEPLMDSDRVVRRVDQDVATADRLGILGTPSFLINGRRLPGAQRLERFTEIIDGELVHAADLGRAGVPYANISALRTRENFVPAPAKSPPDPDFKDSVTVWNVPLGKSPTLGDPAALVTIVEFADFQSPFAKRAQTTLDAVIAKYGRDIRIVFKHDPAPFHYWAIPAAMLAIEARAEKGEDGFWRASRLLFATPETPSDQDLDLIAGVLKLDPKRTRQAVKDEMYRAEMLADERLALDLNARLSPHFFINGRRLPGAQSVDAFSAIIDEELTKTRAMVASGLPRTAVYAAIMKASKRHAPQEQDAARAAPTTPP